MKIKLLLLIFFIANWTFAQKSKLNISFDERIETLYTVAYFDNYQLINKHNNLYKKTLDHKYSSLRNHPAVALFDTISKKYNFSYYRTVEWALQYSNFPEFKKVKHKLDLEDESITKGKEILLENFREELIKFNQDSLFQNYLSEIKSKNDEVIKKVLDSKTILNLPSYLEEYYGKKLFSYNLILSPLVHSGGFNAEIVNDKDKTEVYAIVGPNGEVNFYPHFDKEYLETDLILHEFGHSFVNHLMKKYERGIDSLKVKYYNEKLQKNGKNEGYSEWKYVFNEIVLRAIVVNITRAKFGNEKANNLLNFEKGVGFGLVEKVAEKLQKYEKNRNKYNTFEDFYPTLLKEMSLR